MWQFLSSGPMLHECTIMLQLYTAFITVWSGTSFLGDGADTVLHTQGGCFVLFLKNDIPDLNPDSIYAFSQYRNGFVCWKWVNET